MFTADTQYLYSCPICYDACSKSEEVIFLASLKGKTECTSMSRDWWAIGTSVGDEAMGKLRPVEVFNPTPLNLSKSIASNHFVSL